MPAQITGFTTTPSRKNPSTFSADMDTHISELAQFVADANALSLEVSAESTDVSELTAQAGAYAAAAAGAAASASAAVGAPKWVSGTTYAEGACVWAPSNGLSYRRKVGMGGAGTTDPASDPTNWTPLIVSPTWSVINSDTTANVGAGYWLDSSGTGFNLTLPASPNTNDAVYWGDLGYAGVSDSKKITVLGNGANVMGASSFIIDVSYASGQFKYSGATYGWRVL